MFIAAIRSILAHAARAAVDKIRYHGRKHHNARVVCHLQSLPPYLRRDIGLADGADLAKIVEHGAARGMHAADACRPLSILPHAA